MGDRQYKAESPRKIHEGKRAQAPGAAEPPTRAVLSDHKQLNLLRGQSWVTRDSWTSYVGSRARGIY